MTKEKSLTIVIPIYNGSTTLDEVFSSLEQQKHKELINEIILINDSSTDDSLEIVSKYSQTSSYKTRIIDHDTSHGLAANYNKGMSLSTTDYVILMHQDIVLPDLDSFTKILKPFQNDGKVVVSYPTLLHPFEVWRTYNFWQKCLFSRFVEKEMSMMTGKFDCFNKRILLDKVGEFDAATYRTAGEDSDIKARISKIELKLLPSNIKVIHIHNREKNFGFMKLVKKEAQIAEAQGVVLRKQGVENLYSFVLTFFRPILIFSLLIPFINMIGILSILVYSILYTKKVYSCEINNSKIFYLPLINIYLLFNSTYFSLKGLYYGKQTI